MAKVTVLVEDGRGLVLDLPSVADQRGFDRLAKEHPLNPNTHLPDLWVVLQLERRRRTNPDPKSQRDVQVPLAQVYWFFRALEELGIPDDKIGDHFEMISEHAEQSMILALEGTVRCSLPIDRPLAQSVAAKVMRTVGMGVFQTAKGRRLALSLAEKLEETLILPTSLPNMPSPPPKDALDPTIEAELAQMNEQWLQTAAAQTLAVANERHGTSFQNYYDFIDWLVPRQFEQALEWDLIRIRKVQSQMRRVISGDEQQIDRLFRKMERESQENFSQLKARLDSFVKSPKDLPSAEIHMEWLRQRQDPFSPLRQGHPDWVEYESKVKQLPTEGKYPAPPHK